MYLFQFSSILVSPLDRRRSLLVVVGLVDLHDDLAGRSRSPPFITLPSFLLSMFGICRFNAV
jgi:hypothetical protein